MNDNQLHRRHFLGLCLSASTLTGCGIEAFARSKRQVPPDFDQREPEHGRFVVAPYSLALVENRYLPLPRADLRSLNKPYDDQHEATLELFYSLGVADARQALRKALPQSQLLHIDTPRWKDYFADAAHFRSVSFDGKQRYAVPERETLKSFGVDADYAIVIGSMSFNKFGNLGSEVLNCVARFLVWDYAHARAVAEGEVTAGIGIGIGEHVTVQHWGLLGGQLPREILLKPPFAKDE
jgi:hypothetical protein